MSDLESFAERFVTQHGDNVRYWRECRMWLLRDASRWVQDRLGTVVELAKQSAKSIYAEAAGLPEDEANRMVRLAERSLMWNKITGMLRLAKRGPRITIADEPISVRFAYIRDHEGQGGICSTCRRHYASRSGWEAHIFRCQPANGSEPR